ncbi:hypothetical protein AALA90_16190 [Lachnospiraceae bacterium 38-10]
MNEIKITIEGLNELTEAVRALAGRQGGQASYQSSPQQTVAPTAGVPNYGTGQIPISAPVQPQNIPPQMQTTQGQQTPAMLPTTAVSPGYSLEQLQVAAAGLTSMGKTPQVVGILQRFGIQAMTELPKERYGEFAVALREAGAQI